MRRSEGSARSAGAGAEQDTATRHGKDRDGNIGRGVPGGDETCTRTIRRSAASGRDPVVRTVETTSTPTSARGSASAAARSGRARQEPLAPVPRHRAFSARLQKYRGVPLPRAASPRSARPRRAGDDSVERSTPSAGSSPADTRSAPDRCRGALARRGSILLERSPSQAKAALGPGRACLRGRARGRSPVGRPPSRQPGSRGYQTHAGFARSTTGQRGHDHRPSRSLTPSEPTTTLTLPSGRRDTVHTAGTPGARRPAAPAPDTLAGTSGHRRSTSTTCALPPARARVPRRRRSAGAR